MKKRLSQSIAFVLSVMFLFALGINRISLNATELDVGDNIPVTRALVAKMLALTYRDMASIDSMDREITFSDTDISKWYDKYINAVCVDGLMSGSDGKFRAEDYLTVTEAQIVLDKIYPANKTKIQITADNKNSPISYALWGQLYKNALLGLCGDLTINAVFGIEAKNIVVLAAQANNSQLPKWNIISDKGPFTHAGITMDSYIDKEIRIFYRGSEIILVVSVESVSPMIQNAYIVRNSVSEVTVFSGGCERTFKYVNSLGDQAGKICDIVIKGNNALELKLKNEKTSGVIKQVGDKVIETDKKQFTTHENFKVYSMSDGMVKWSYPDRLIVGNDMAYFFYEGTTVYAAVIYKSAAAPSTVRIALNRTGFSGIVHPSVSFTATSAFSVTSGSETKKYKAGQVVTVSATENTTLMASGRIYIKPDSNNGRVRITSIQRNWTNSESPLYRGIIEIAKEENGFTVVNELDTEQYLYAVVPSEMPTSYGSETAKIQAITARSYVYKQYYDNGYRKYGAHLDDSTSSHVYNNIPENDISIKAVNDTKGMCLTYNGDVISAYYFSTSSGMTANSGEVWADKNKAFPTETSDYYISAKQFVDEAGAYGNLNTEDGAWSFLKATNVDAYEKNFSWFRWNVEMTGDEIGASINANLEARYAAAPRLIQTLQSNGTFRSVPIKTIGQFKNMEVMKRGSGGNIMEMLITGTEATILVKTEYNIRTLIRPYKYLTNGGNIVLNRIDKTQISNYSLMPSAFYVFEKVLDSAGNAVKVMFYGGGNGHGVGMSQNGAKGMIDRGFTYEQVLQHYYAGTEIKKVF